MNNPTQTNTVSDLGWDKYWQGAKHSHAFSDSGVSHPAIHEFWRNFFTTIAMKKSDHPLKILDIASGNGALVEIGKRYGPSDGLSYHCVDSSLAAIAQITASHPEVVCEVCDANNIPYEEQSFDYVVSQFGIEYAGSKAINNAASWLAPGGQLTLLIHCTGGIVEQECRDNLHEIKTILNSNVIPKARDMFNFGFQAMKGGDRKRYDQAAAELNTALPLLEQYIVANQDSGSVDTVLRLYDDIATIHERMPHFNDEEVLEWLAQMQLEFDAFSERMQSMMAASLDEDQFQAIARAWEEAGLEIVASGPMIPTDNDKPLAWAISATRA